MAECKTKVGDVGVVKEWCGTAGEFIKLILKPGCPPKPSDAPDACAKWIVFQFQALLLGLIIGVLDMVLGSMTTFLLNQAVSLVINAWLQGWIFWFSFVKRESDPCCCFIIVTITGWKYMHLLVGIAFVLQGLSNAFNQLNWLRLLGLDFANVGPALIVSILWVACFLLYALGMIGTGLCMVKLGAKKAGVEIPAVDAEKVGAP